MPKLERDYQAGLVRHISRLFPGCVIIKNDPNYQQGFPDLTILHGRRWAVLEVKRSINEAFEPNQVWFIQQLDELSFSAMICPENEEEVLLALQHAFRDDR